jgi:hypothetical protein
MRSINIKVFTIKALGSVVKAAGLAVETRRGNWGFLIYGGGI